MKKILFILLSSISLLFTVACTRDVVLKLDPVPPVLVLNATITPEQEVAAFLSKSWFLLDSVPEYNLPENGVSIHVYVNDVFKGNMQRNDNPADSLELKGQYKLPGCYVKTGDRVRLEAEAPGFNPVTAETLVPEKTHILAIDTVSVQYSSHYKIYLTLKDNPAERNYYRLIVECITEYRKGDSVMWVSLFNNNWGAPKVTGAPLDIGHFWNSFSLSYDDPVFYSYVPTPNESNGSESRGLFSDELFSGKEYTVTVSFSADKSFVTDTMTVSVDYDIHLLSVSEDYYNYMKVINDYTFSLGDAFLENMEPSATYSNVEDGFGVVAGYQVSTRRITMPISDAPFYEW